MKQVRKRMNKIRYKIHKKEYKKKNKCGATTLYLQMGAETWRTLQLSHTGDRVTGNQVFPTLAGKGGGKFKTLIVLHPLVVQLTGQQAGDWLNTFSVPTTLFLQWGQKALEEC